MTQTSYLLSGTFLLTFTGFLTRIAGFFYKIFLSRTIGAEQIGLFQLSMPVFAFFSAFASGGIQTAVSRFTSEYSAREDRQAVRNLLILALCFSGSLSLLASCLLYVNAEWIAARFLMEVRCVSLLRILAVSLPFCVIHNCFCGYFIGLKKIMPSALSQLMEQSFRIGGVFLFYVIITVNGGSMDAAVMALGQLFGELASAVYCLIYVRTVSAFHKHRITEGNRDTDRYSHSIVKYLRHTIFRYTSACRSPGNNTPDRPAYCSIHTLHRKTSIPKSLLPLLSVSVPLSLNRMLMCIFQGAEAALLPQQLLFCGYSSAEALSSYGTLTGMAFPLIFFPTAVTGALGTLLLPAVSEARALHRTKRISDTANACFYASTILGLLFALLFLLTGPFIGTLLFESRLAGAYIRQLGLLCPFLYLNTTMISILHGIGKSTAIFLCTVGSALIRLCFIILFVPSFGINAYLYGMLCSQAFLSVCILLMLICTRHLTFELPYITRHRRNTY